MGENRRQSDCSSCQTQDAQAGLVGGSAGSTSARPTKHDHEPGTPSLQQRHCERTEPHNSQRGQEGKIIFMSFTCIFLSVTQKKKKILKTLGFMAWMEAEDWTQLPRRASLHTSYSRFSRRKDYSQNVFCKGWVRLTRQLTSEFQRFVKMFSLSILVEGKQEKPLTTQNRTTDPSLCSIW